MNENRKRLNTEIIQIKSKNILDKKIQFNYINNTIDSIRNSIGFISDVKKTILRSKFYRKKKI